MLLSLTIRDLVLIDRLELVFSPHLSVLTGETGAGKSILLDALGLALGMRAESGLVRPGGEQAIITAVFRPPDSSPVYALLSEQGIEHDETLILRRIVGREGRSRAFVNDQAVSVGFLKSLGAYLVEIQGQFDQHGLMDETTHAALLDAYASAEPLLNEVQACWSSWRTASAARRKAEAAIASARADEAWLRHAIEELDQLRPEPEEETQLAERRTLLSHQAQIDEAIRTALYQLRGDRGVESTLNQALRQLERVRERARGRLDEAIAALEGGLVEIIEGTARLESAREEETGSLDLDRVEERLVELRTLARKHGVQADRLHGLRTELGERLGSLERGGEELSRLAAAEAEARAAYIAASERLNLRRREAASRFERAILDELAPLKLDRARFHVEMTILPESDWGAQGTDHIALAVATNPGMPPGPLARVASSGELSRLLLALKTVLARVSVVPTLVFDEVDSGVGGAVAAAVGERLQRLGIELQVLVVTHSPQVAARGATHWRVLKDQGADATVTRIEKLGQREREEEIARMLSGSVVTSEARAAAASLLKTAQAS